jgi:E3 ubiquitin-protein ligase MARCH6
MWDVAVLKSNFREPLSDVPLDLILLHLLLPYTMHYFRPVRSIKKIAEHLWRVFAARLRLTSYMFGDRHPVEERSPKHWSWPWLIQRQDVEVDDPDYVRDGTFRRVPATDNLALPRDMRATARVTENGEPVDEEARTLIAQQNAEAEKAKRLAKDDYTIVYIPPNLRRRIILFISIMWIIGSVFFGIVLAAPILLGRGVFRVLLNREVHDGYSLITGFYLFWACYVFGKAIDRMDKRRQRRGGEGPRADLLVYVFKRSLLWSAKALYMVLCLGLVIPLLIALVMELYLILPIRYGVNPDATPRIRIVDMWCLGILYSKIALYSTQLQPMSRVTAGVRNVRL